MIKLESKVHDLGGGFVVRRVLPTAKKRMVGPFIFFDHMGPLMIKANQNTDVRPHPHIGLSTLTYLFEGRMLHRDSLGIVQSIVPGEVNWMTAGRGISHSERSHPEDKIKDRNMHGLQFWVALPKELEECDPSFQHLQSFEVPKINDTHYDVTLVAGNAFGRKSPLQTSSPTLLADFQMKSEGKVDLKFSDQETAVYVIQGQVEVSNQSLNPYELGLLESTDSLLSAAAGTRFIVFGGKSFPEVPHIWWNLVSSSRERLEKAKEQWKNGSFPMVPGETEKIPLPEN